MLGHDRHILTGQAIEQARLSDIGCAGQHHHQPFAQCTALPRRPEHRFQFTAHDREPLKRIRLGKEVDAILLREIQRRFDQDAQIQQAIGHPVDRRGELARQRAQCATRCLLAGRVDQVGDRFRLRQVDAFVDVGATGELARLGDARTQFDTALKDAAQHDRTAMSVQFKHVFTRERSRPGEPERHADIQGSSAAVAERAQRRQPIRRHTANHTFGDPGRRRPGHPYDS